MRSIIRVAEGTRGMSCSSRSIGVEYARWGRRVSSIGSVIVVMIIMMPLSNSAWFVVCY